MTATTRLGTAYRTNAEPVMDPDGSVYAVFPSASFAAGTRSTTHLLVISSGAVGDTCVYPSTNTGAFAAYELLGHVLIRNHRAGLRAAGYELEVPTHGHK